MMRRVETVLLAAVLAVGLEACSARGGGEGGPSSDPVRQTSSFFLPTGEPGNTGNPSVEVDAKGRLHFVYPADALGDVYYAFCPSNCGSAEQMRVVRLETPGAVTQARIAVGPDGRPQLLLSTLQSVSYASCVGDCTQPGAWTVTPLFAHQADIQVTGDAFALTPEGKPRFLMHAPSRVSGADPDPATFYVQCDGDCQRPTSWTASRIAQTNQVQGTLRFTPSGQARMVAAERRGDSDSYIGLYAECDGDCAQAASWKRMDLYGAFSGASGPVPMEPAIALRLTREGQPRVGLIGDDGKGRNLVYLECEANCTTSDGWHGQILLPSNSGGETLNAGLSLALDGQDRPRIAYAAGDDILLGSCDTDCANEDHPTWTVAQVERSGDMRADQIVPYPDCALSGAWMLTHPVLALGKDGLPRVAYRAQDVAGEGRPPAPGGFKCQAGPDMAFGRFTQLDTPRGP